MIHSDRLHSRPTPGQRRARDRVRLILATTAELLLRHPPLAITTTMIAEAADIPVSSIYRYFPSAEDVLRELYLQSGASIRQRILEALDEPAGSWRERMRAALMAQIDHIAATPHYRPLMLLFLPKGGQLAIDAPEHGMLERYLVAHWQAGGDGFTGGDPAVVARMVVKCALSVEEMIAADPARAARYYDELLRLLDTYLGQYLPP